MAYYNSYYPYSPAMNAPVMGNPAMNPMMNTVTPQAPMSNSSQPSQSNIIWVQGEAGAKAYIVAPNCSVALWDSENQNIYIKTVDASGIPSMRIMQWTEITNAPKNALAQSVAPTPVDLPAPSQINDYVTKEEFNSLADKFKNLSEQFNTLSSKTNTNNSNNSNPKPYNQPKKEDKNNG